MNALAVAVALCLIVLAGGVLAEFIVDWAWNQRRQMLLAIAAVLAMIACGLFFTQIPAPVTPQQEEPTPYTCADLKPWIDVMLTNQEQMLHYLEIIAAPTLSATAPILSATPTSTPVIPDNSPTPTNTPVIPDSSPTPTVIPTSTPTPTANPYVARCGVCLDSLDCAPGYTCIYCGGKRRCVDRNFPNSDCQKCKEELGIP
jgi:hypothetical protein